MKLLIGGSSSKFFHLKEFADALNSLGVETKLVVDSDIYDGFPSRKITNWFQSKSKFNNLLDNFKPDAIFVDRQRHFSLAATETKLPVFMLLRGDFWTELQWSKETLYKSPYKRIALSQWQKIGEKCFSDASVILPICKYLENIVKNHYSNKPTEVLYQGINPSRWYPAGLMNLKHPCVGLLQGAWIWGKVREMSILSNVLEAMPSVTFYWAGDGPYRDEILKVLKKYENFKWLGPLQYPDKVREYLSSIDVYALISGMDMSPLTLQEAQLMERPVVATRIGGIPELMSNEKTGLLVGKGDHRGWIEKLTILINDKEKAKVMGIEGRKYVTENFSWDKIAKKFVSVLDTYAKK
ncbi:MAG: glycosyltransferase family 4 protein [Nitrosotalea sp.]